MRLAELIYKNECTFEHFPDDLEINTLGSQMHELNKADLFIINKSINININTIIKDIELKSPKVIVCETGTEIISHDSIILYTENTRKLCAHIYSRFYQIDYKSCDFIAITGTNGKTGTATILSEILRNSGKSVGFIGSGKIQINGEDLSKKNYSMTTPDPNLLYPTISQMQKMGAKYIIMEASSHALWLDKLSPIPFKIGVFTNLSEEHLDFHHSMQEYFKAKLKLFWQCKFGVFNNDDEYSQRAAMITPSQNFSIGIFKNADTMLREIVEKGFEGSDYIYTESNKIFRISIHLVGIYNIYNSAMAIKCALLLGIAANDIKSALNSLYKIDGRFEIINECPTVIIDYAHTAMAVENLLKSINSIKNIGQKIYVIFGCGGNRDKFKRAEIAASVEKYADYITVTNDNPRNENEDEIIQDIIDGFTDSAIYKIIKDRASAIYDAIKRAKECDIIALIGKGHEKYMIDKNGYHDFDERAIVQSALQERYGNYEKN